MDINQTIAVILPGRREFVSSPSYQRLGNVFTECGIKPEYIQPNWGLTSVAEITRDTARQIRAVVQPNQPIFGLGFSLGALCVLKSSEQVNFKASILCSMSFFSEEIPYMGALLRFFTKRVIYRGGEILQYPPVRPEHKYYFVYGQKELRKIPEGILTLRSNRFNEGQTIVAAKAGHNISHHGYQAALASLIRNLALNNQFEPAPEALETPRLLNASICGKQ